MQTCFLFSYAKFGEDLADDILADGSAVQFVEGGNGALQVA